MPNAPFLAPGRDPAFKIGRAKSSGATFYSIPGCALTTLGAAAGDGINIDFYEPIFVATPLIVDQMAIEVTAAAGSGNMRIGVYAADTDWQPVGPPLADSGDISTATTGVKTYTPGTPIFLPRNRYVGVYNYSVAGNSFRFFRGLPPGGALRSALGTAAYLYKIYVARTYAAFPTPGTAWTTEAGGDVAIQPHSIVYRISQP